MSWAEEVGVAGLWGWSEWVEEIRAVRWVEGASEGGSRNAWCVEL